MSTIEIDISAVEIGTRARTDTDVSDLVKSISDVGLIHPIVVDEQNRLICGYRRLQAVKQLGWNSIPITVSANSAETLQALKMERDENDQRKPFAPSEAVAMAKMIEDQVKREARDRQREAGGDRKSANSKIASGQLTGSDQPEPKTKSEQNRAAYESRSVIADAVGFTEATLRRAKTAVANGIPEVIEAMDQGKISTHKASKIAMLPEQEQLAALAEKKPMPKKAESAEKKKPDRIKGSEDAFNQPDSPFSAKTIRVRVVHMLDGLRLTDPNAREQLLIIKDRIEEMLNTLEQAA